MNLHYQRPTMIVIHFQIFANKFLFNIVNFYSENLCLIDWQAEYPRRYTRKVEELEDFLNVQI